MEFGLLCTADTDGRGLRHYLDLNVEAETLGFRSTFLVEHHFSGWNQVSATLMLLTALATETTTIRLGSAVMVLSWHNPVLLAEQVATLDVISGGRVDFGIGKGYRHSEFHGFGIDPGDAAARFDEAIAVILQAWACRERFSHRGRFWRFEDIVVEPPPVQQPHPPLWVAAASDQSIARAATRGFNLILDQYASPEEIGRRIDRYRADGGRGDIAVGRQVYVAKDRADADAALAMQAAFTERTLAVSRAPGESGGAHVLAYDGVTEKHAMFGTEPEIERHLAALKDIGVEYVLVQLAGGFDQLRRFADLAL
jgi:alkanesulfonate monooxygenase SsuD/methylene tetrahydromethanopterin reductase-like flavin-dependent oxidoreductase (luciferase family)